MTPAGAVVVHRTPSGYRVRWTTDSEGRAARCLGFISGEVTRIDAQPYGSCRLSLMNSLGADLLAGIGGLETARTIRPTRRAVDGSDVSLICGRVAVLIEGASSGDLDIQVTSRSARSIYIEWDETRWLDIDGSIIYACALPSVGDPPTAEYSLSLIDEVTSADVLLDGLVRCPIDSPKIVWIPAMEVRARRVRLVSESGSGIIELFSVQGDKKLV